jgi:DNA-binding Lrp family transcriptional regulator
MPRRDIADYLGITLETVSRALSSLQDSGILGFDGNTQRRIVLLDRLRLSDMEQGTGEDASAVRLPARASTHLPQRQPRKAA